MVFPKPTILYLAMCDPDLSVTGVTVRMGAFIKYLAAYYDITLVNLTGSGHDAEPLPHPTAIDRIVQHRVQIPFSQTGYFLFSPPLYRAANQLLSQHHYDYLVADYGLAALYGVRLAQQHNIPLIYCSSNVEYQMYWELGQHDWRRFPLVPYVYWAERSACRVAYRVVTVSERDRQAYAQWTDKSKIVTIPQGFDPEQMNPFYPPPPRHPPIVLFTGSFRDTNNRQAARFIAQELAPQIAQVMPEVNFQLVGSHPPEDVKGPNVQCFGFVDDIVPYLQRANVVIAPMSFGHGISTKVVLGLAYGKTVLTTPPVAGGMPRCYESLHVAPLEQFAEQLIALLKARPTVSPQAFETLCQDLAWPNLIAQLSQQIATDTPVSQPLTLMG